MTQNTHTPGPWEKVHDHPDPKTAISVGYIRPSEKYSGYQFEIATVYGCNGVYDGDMEPEANARLIAAAPELLEALEEIRDMLWSRPDISDRLRPLMGFAEEATNQKAASAIAKARGQS